MGHVCLSSTFVLPSFKNENLMVQIHGHIPHRQGPAAVVLIPMAKGQPHPIVMMWSRGYINESALLLMFQGMALVDCKRFTCWIFGGGQGLI